jgi:hypothetical protein
MSALEAILEFQDADFIATPYDGSGAHQPWALLLRDASYAGFLEEYNGLYAFDRALHLFGADPSRPFHDLSARNDAAAEWRRPHGRVLQGVWFFAEDLFGHLFGLRGNEAVAFDPETGEIEVVAEGFEGWLRYIDSDTNYAVGQSVALEWSEERGPLAFGSRLSPKTPFALGGEFDLENLQPLAWDENLRILAEAHGKIRDLPV